MHKTIKFNGITKDYLYLLRGSERPAWAPVENTIIEIPGMAGGYISETKKKVRVLNLVVGVKLPHGFTFEQVEEDIAEWLVTDREAELILSDEPERTYYAKVEGTLSLNRMRKTAQGVITFICPDSYKYGVERIADFPSSGVTTVYNYGTADADPVFEMVVQEPITFAMVQNQNDEYMMIGRPIDVESFVVKEKELILHDTMQSFVGWTNGSYVDGGAITGSMKSDGTTFLADNYGTGNGWHGPSVKKSLSETLQDFRVDCMVELRCSVVEMVGRVEIYLLDAANAVIGKIALKDFFGSARNVYGEARAGSLGNGHYLISEDEGYKRGAWNDFYGMLRLQRVGNKWEAWIQQYDRVEKRYHSRRIREFDDIENKYMNKLAQIQVHVAVNGTRPAPNAIKIDDIKVWKINNPEDNQVPYIADAGDVITFDHTQNGEVLINGEPYENINFGSSFFKLTHGINQLVVMPNFSTTTVAFRERYK